MGQYWKVINLDRDETMGVWGKLGECLFDTTPSMLILFLGVPTSPITSSSHSRGQPIGSWAGDRIICIGDYAEDYPPDLLTAGEVASLKAKLDEDDSAINLYCITDDFHHCPTISTPEELCTDDIWVLRKLTKFEYVRADTLTVSGTPVRGAFTGFPGLGEVVLSRISWSTGNSTSMSYKGDITRGVWAGDRFDIRTIESTENPCNGEHWKDVSEEVTQEIFAIWESEYGPNWIHQRYLSTHFSRGCDDCTQYRFQKVVSPSYAWSHWVGLYFHV
jgi:hypothetical protein